jgi:hypothetical protein
VKAFEVQLAEYVTNISQHNFINQAWDEDNGNLQSIVIACPDNYQTRNQMFTHWCQDSSREMFISVGLLADIYHIKVFFKGDEDKWVNRSDDEEESTNCTYQQSMYCAKGLHSKVVEIVNKYVMGLQNLIEHEYRYNGITG